MSFDLTKLKTTRLLRFIISIESTTENQLLSNIESYDFPLWKVNGIVIP